MKRKQSKIFKYLPIKEVFSYCQTDRRFWSYLLKRDFPFKTIILTEHDNLRQHYIFYYRLTKTFNEIILTEYVIDMIEKFFPERFWNIYRKIVPEKLLTMNSFILSLHNLNYIHDTSDTQDTYDFFQFINSDLLKTLEEYKNTKFTTIIGRSSEQVIDELNKTEFEIKPYVEIPLLIFIGEKSFFKNRNIELLETIQFNMNPDDRYFNLLSYYSNIIQNEYLVSRC